MLKEYIDNILKKGIIKKLKLLTINSMLWALKAKNLIKKLYVNYRKFNKLTIMNRYLLPLVYKLWDRFYRVIIFTKFNLRVTFNLIWIKANNKWKIIFRL